MRTHDETRQDSIAARSGRRHLDWLAGWQPDMMAMPIDRRRLRAMPETAKAKLDNPRRA